MNFYLACRIYFIYIYKFIFDKRFIYLESLIYMMFSILIDVENFYIFVFVLLFQTGGSFYIKYISTLQDRITRLINKLPPGSKRLKCLVYLTIMIQNVRYCLFNYYKLMSILIFISTCFLPFFALHFKDITYLYIYVQLCLFLIHIDLYGHVLSSIILYKESDFSNAYFEKLADMRKKGVLIRQMSKMGGVIVGMSHTSGMLLATVAVGVATIGTTLYTSNRELMLKREELILKEARKLKKKEHKYHMEELRIKNQHAEEMQRRQIEADKANRRSRWW